MIEKATHKLWVSPLVLLFARLLMQTTWRLLRSDPRSALLGHALGVREQRAILRSVKTGAEWLCFKSTGRRLLLSTRWQYSSDVVKPSYIAEGPYPIAQWSVYHVTIQGVLTSGHPTTLCTPLILADVLKPSYIVMLPR